MIMISHPEAVADVILTAAGTLGQLAVAAGGWPCNDQAMPKEVDANYFVMAKLSAACRRLIPALPAAGPARQLLVPLRRNDGCSVSNRP